MQISEKEKSRFWSLANESGQDQCWNWSGTTVTGGYGIMWFQKKTTLATHISLLLDGRPRPMSPSDLALHSDGCTPSCVNPHHLRWGSQLENMADRERLGRRVAPKGAAHGRATPDTMDNRFRKLLAVYLPNIRKDISAQINASPWTVGEIRAGRKWAHIQIPAPERVKAFLQAMADDDVKAGIRTIPGFAITEERRI